VKTLSVIIPNYNYGDYVGAAIESALALDWPDVEVIVVDDGSSDHSRAVIARYAGRVTTVLQENAGQGAAYNRGFAQSRGDVVVFLDSDDLLAPSLPRELAAAWTPSVSKVQFQMRVIDAAGRPTGHAFPRYGAAPRSGDLRDWFLATGAYPTPPGSGNAYARWFLERALPVPSSCSHDATRRLCRVCAAADSFLLALAPLFGDVLTVPLPLASYRIHGRNEAAISHLDLAGLQKEMERGRLRHAYASSVAERAGLPRPARDALDRNLAYLSYGIAVRKLAPERLPQERLARMLLKLCAACMTPQGVSAKSRLLILAWACAVTLAPGGVARRFARWRFVLADRPGPVRAVVAALTGAA